MIKQGNFEGYCTNAWEYRWQRYMRVANYRPGRRIKHCPAVIFVPLRSSKSNSSLPLQRSLW